MQELIWNFEQEPSGEPLDDSGRNLRAYFDRMPDEKMRQYSREWTDEQVVEWDGNFTTDGHLLLICVMRDVEIDEYRETLEECIEYRNRVRPILSKTAGD